MPGQRLGTPDFAQRDPYRQNGNRRLARFAAILLVIRGIYSSKFSPTEAAGVTAGFCAIVGVLFYPVYRFIHAGDASHSRHSAEEYSETTGFLERIVIAREPALPPIADIKFAMSAFGLIMSTRASGAWRLPVLCIQNGPFGVPVLDAQNW